MTSSRWFKIAKLAVSHVAVCAAVAALTGEYLVQREFERARTDPLTRLGMRFEAPPEARDSFPELAEDVRAAGAKLDPVTEQVLQLVGEVRSNDMTGATRTCMALGWPDCQPATLDKMWKALVQ